jgi:hypothetical protein
MSSNITWGIIFGIMIGAVGSQVMHSTALGIGLGAAVAVIVALAWSAFNSRPRRER